MSSDDKITETVDGIATAKRWNKRIALIRKIPEEFGKAQHQDVYARVAERVYVPNLVPDFAYIHWRDEYELPQVESAYEHAHALTDGFSLVDAAALANAIESKPATLRVFRLLLGFTTQEFAASTVITGDELGLKPLTNGVVKALEEKRPATKNAAMVAAAVIDQAMRGKLFTGPGGEVRSKLDKPDTANGWKTVRQYASGGVPLAVFLHQRHYGGAFRQLLDATSSKRGDLLEEAVEELFKGARIQFVRTGPNTQEKIAKKFGLTVKPAPDFVVQDTAGTIKALLECKQANDGGTARDKAARFANLRTEAMRLGGVPVFAVLAGLGWRRTGDALGPVVRDTDGRVFTAQTLDDLMTVEPFPGLRGRP